MSFPVMPSTVNSPSTPSEDFATSPSAISEPLAPEGGLRRPSDSGPEALPGATSLAALTAASCMTEPIMKLPNIIPPIDGGSAAGMNAPNLPKSG